MTDRFDEALRLHKAGRLAKAARLYRKLVANQPTHAGARHTLGVLAPH